MKGLIAITLLSTLLLFSSCEKEAEIDIPTVKPQLVVTAFICPQDTIITVMVDRSASVFRTRIISEWQRPEFGSVEDALVTLSDGTRTVTLPYDSMAQLYSIPSSQMPIVADGHYTLTVSGLGQTVNSSCTVPKEVNTLSATATVEDKPYPWDDNLITRRFNMNANWTDIFPEVNYYRITGKSEMTREDEGGQQYPSYWTIGFDKDIRKDNNQLASQFSASSYESVLHFRKDRPYKMERLECHLLHIDENYYKYYEWLRNNTEDNPFAEPQLVFTNIKGGLGIFAAYNKSSVTLDVFNQ